MNKQPELSARYHRDDNEPPQSILVVDDDDPFRERLARALRSRGLNVETAPNPAAATATLAFFKPEGAIVDLRMPEGSGFEVLEAIRSASPSTRVVILTGFGSVASAVSAVRLGACNFIEKPADADDVLAAFSRGSLPPSESIPEQPRTPSLARAEWEYMQRVLADCGHNISEAARRLGIHRRSLQRKLGKQPPME